MSGIYNKEYYHSGCGPVPYEEPEHWVAFFGAVADRIVADFHPKTVLDAGCAMGYLVAALRDRGVDAYGIDISEYAISKVREDVRPYCAVCSLTDPIPESFPQKFDLVTNIEVMEHLSAADGEIAIGNLCGLTERILFSSTADDVSEPTHINVQQREYWAGLFAKFGFFRRMDYSVGYVSAVAIVYEKQCDVAKAVEQYERECRILCAKLEQISEGAKLQTALSKVFFDTGSGYNEGTSLSFDVIGGKLDIVAELPQGVRSVRFDPADNAGCFVRNFIVSADGEEVAYRLINGEEIAGGHLFLTEDPQYEIVLEGIGATALRFRGEVFSFRDPALFELLGSLKEMSDAAALEHIEFDRRTAELEDQHRAELIAIEDRHEAELKDFEAKLKDFEAKLDKTSESLEHYKLHYHAAINQREDLKRQLAQAREAYNTISNAAFWKITAPFRKLTDGLKRLCRKSKLLRLTEKGLRCLKENGWKYTWRKVFRRKVSSSAFSETSLLSAEDNPNEAIDESIKFSVLVPLYNTPRGVFKEMVESVLAQSYQNWELCMVDASAEGRDLLSEYQNHYGNDPRIKYRRLQDNFGISDNTNACAEMATGEYIALLDHDDILQPYALYHNAVAIRETDADVLYSDEDHLTASGEHINPFFKPDWSPDLLYSQMYICHLLVFKKSLFAEVGGFRREFDGSQDDDLMLRMSEKTNRICHIPRVLYSWRESENSTAANADSKPYAHTAGLRALNEHLKRKYGSDAYAEETEHTFVYSPRFPAAQETKVSIIIPFKDACRMTDECVESILQKTEYQNFEILLLNNRSEQEETGRWIEKVEQRDHRIRVLDADMEFNWSKINNFGIRNAEGEVFVFLNNDTTIISEDWLTRLVENAIRPDAGVVGGLLLYEDRTIQHAGVVVGIGGWADHVFKGMDPVHFGAPYVSPMVSRNVLAVTGACLAVSRKTIERIGCFDEGFVICGSDIELGIRAHEKGLFNRYDANVRLYHFESKSRDSYIPQVDFEKSYEAYEEYRENVDPYFNVNLDPHSTTPKERPVQMGKINFRNFVKRCPLAVKTYRAVKAAFMEPHDYSIAEIQPLVPRKTEKRARTRINLLVPSVDKKHVFGGIATAMRFFEELRAAGDYEARLIVTDAEVNLQSATISSEYRVVRCDDKSDAPMQIVGVADREGKTIPVAENDIFVATGWWTAYIVADVIRWQKDTFGTQLPLIYMIQDYEPGFYPWSSRYIMADSTYRFEFPVYAIINSSQLKQHFNDNGYKFARNWCFEPKLNDSLKPFLPKDGETIKKKKQILIYGRPSTARNAFELIIYALKEWCEKMDDPSEWTVLSAGEQHKDVDLGRGVALHSVGKLSLEDYAEMMLDTYAGISLMVSPHPSYPPLEMAAFGVKVITNSYRVKDLTEFSDNVVSLDDVSPNAIAENLVRICSEYLPEQACSRQINREYYENADSEIFDIASDVVMEIKKY